MSRKNIVAGNWKMNLLADEAKELFAELIQMVDKQCEVLIFPPAIYLDQFIRLNNGNIGIGAQNAYPVDQGAFTGEISMTQLKSLGVNYVLVGHSERRAYFGEHHEFLKMKINAALENEITPVFCCGEPLSIREKGEEFSFVKQQLDESLFHLSESELKKCIIAYEPVWAIGTGVTASVDQAESMHAAIRSWIVENYGQLTANEISILYGGSCNASNASELFACPNVDGGLIGGASLKKDSFEAITNAF